MIDTMWVAQAAQSGSVSGQASGAMLRSALADLTSAFEAAGLSLIFITLVCVNVRLWFRVYASSCNSRGCSRCRGRSVCQALIGVALNTVAFLLAAWRHVDAVGSHTPLISGAGSFFLVGIALLSLVAALVFGVAGINALMDAPRIGAQCPLEQGETGDSTASAEDGGTARWESQAARCGSAWERELAGALGRKQ